MPKICYVPKRFGASSQAIIDQANQIITTYAAQGFDLTLRQLYYQFVSRALIANRDTEYKRLGAIINDARLAGLIDWDAITDRTRNLMGLRHWNDPGDIVYEGAFSFRYDKWKDQDWYPEVWIEKDALTGVINGVCAELDVNYFSCRGYTSQSEMWGAAMRLARKDKAGQKPVIFHLGDHDPSGKDMTRDIQDRVNLFYSHHAGETIEWVEINRLALNMDQIRQYNPPPNPAKVTDSRSTGYIEEFGAESWELDALEPTVLADLIREAVSGIIDQDLWDETVVKEEAEREAMKEVARRWADVKAFVLGGSHKPHADLSRGYARELEDDEDDPEEEDDA